MFQKTCADWILEGNWDLITHSSHTTRSADSANTWVIHFFQDEGKDLQAHVSVAIF